MNLSDEAKRYLQIYSDSLSDDKPFLKIILLTHVDNEMHRLYHEAIASGLEPDKYVDGFLMNLVGDIE